MRKLTILLLILTLWVNLSACGTSAVGDMIEAIASPADRADFSADSVTVHDLGEGWSREITDPDALAALSGLDTSDWKALNNLAEQVSACAVYVMDFGNGTVIGYLGDGYIQLGTAFEWTNEDRTGYRIADSVQYQVPEAVTELLWGIITE